MPLLDHFHPPLHLRYPWDSFHSTWATRLADALNDNWLPPDFIAAEHTHAGSSLEIDVATFEEAHGAVVRHNGNATATAPRVWIPPAATGTMPAVFPDTFAVRVFSTVGGLTLVAAIELVSPANKDRAAERRAFAVKSASYLYQGISLIVLDVVTSRRANLHNEMVRLMEAPPDWELPESDLYAVAYRPVRRQEKPEIDYWSAPVSVGAPLPTLPLRLTGDLFVPVDFEAAYQEACRRRRIL